MISKCSIYLSLFCILFIFCVTDSKYDEYHILERNSFLNINIDVQIFLLGFSESDRNSLNIEELKKWLRVSHGTHRPSYVDMGHNTNFQFKFNYYMDFLGDVYMDEFVFLRNEAIEVALSKQKSDKKEQSTVYIDASDISHFFERLSVELSSNQSGKSKYLVYSIFILNPPEHTESYAYSTSKNSQYGSNVWVGSGRWVVADTQATYGAITNEDGVMEKSLNMNMKGLDTIAKKSLFTKFCSHTLNSLFLSHLEMRTRPATKYTIPIVIFKNHNLWNPYTNTPNIHSDEPSINIDEIEREISKMFISSVHSYNFVVSVHGLHEHKQISVALYNSIKYRTKIHKIGDKIEKIERRSYIDTSILRHQLKQSSDILGTLGKRRDDDDFTILPVYVFSLVGIEEGLFLDDYQLMTADEDMIIVLQTNETNLRVPYKINGKYVEVDPMHKVERNIIAGIAKSFGGLSMNIENPNVKGYHNLKTFDVDFTFMFGFHPFGYFSDSNIVSKIFTDSMIRNHIISRTDTLIFGMRSILNMLSKYSKYYFYDQLTLEEFNNPNLLFWVDYFEKKLSDHSRLKTFITNIKNEIQSISLDLVDVAKFIESDHLLEAYKISRNFPKRIRELKENFHDELAYVDIELKCIEKHKSQNQVSGLKIFISLSITLTLFLLIIGKLIRNSRSRLKKVSNDNTKTSSVRYDDSNVNIFQRKHVYTERTLVASFSYNNNDFDD